MKNCAIADFGVGGGQRKTSLSLSSSYRSHSFSRARTHSFHRVGRCVCAPGGVGEILDVSIRSRTGRPSQLNASAINDATHTHAHVVSIIK